MDIIDGIDDVIDNYEKKINERKNQIKEESKIKKMETEQFNDKVINCFELIIIPVLTRAKGKISRRDYECNIDEKSAINTDTNKKWYKELKFTINTDKRQSIPSSLSFVPQQENSMIKIEAFKMGSNEKPTFCNIDIANMTEEKAAQKINEFIKKVFE